MLPSMASVRVLFIGPIEGKSEAMVAKVKALQRKVQVDLVFVLGQYFGARWGQWRPLGSMGQDPFS